MFDYFKPLLMLLQNSALGEIVRSDQYIYPVLESIHILGIALLVGSAFTFDLRLLGLGHKAVSVTTAGRYLLPISRVGFAITVVTGIGLISAQTMVVAGSGATPWKFGLLILAGFNVLVFHYGIYRKVDEWTDVVLTPVAARIAAVVSLISWTGVVFAGRLLAYT